MARHPRAGEYDPRQFRTDQLHTDKTVAQLGAPIDGWTPELIYRYSILIPASLCIDWAIMIDVYRIDENGAAARRRVQRIDICHSEVHLHEFRQSDDPADDQGRRTVLQSISAGDALTVDREFGVQLTLLARDWPDRVRRWIDG